MVRWWVKSLLSFFFFLLYLNLINEETVSDSPIWWHFLSITIPDNLTRPDSGFMVIDGGNNGQGG